MPKKKTKKAKKKSAAKVRSKRGKKAVKKNKKSTKRKRTGTGKNKEPIDWILGWRFFSDKLPPPTYAEVAEFLNCSVRQVEEHGSKNKWQKKIKQLEIDAIEKLNKASTTSLARTKLESLGIVRDLKLHGSLAIADKDWKPKDVIAYINTELKLLGEPDLRIDNVSDREAIKEEFREAIRNGEIDIKKLRSIARRRRKSPDSS